MSVTPALNGAEGSAESLSLTVLQYGKPKFDRRLSDKLLAAFNHAYASGYWSIAERLKNLLQEIEAKELQSLERSNRGTLGPRQKRQSSAVVQSDLWKGFIDARSKYQTILLKSEQKPELIEMAEEDMKHAFAKWSVS